MLVDLDADGDLDLLTAGLEVPFVNRRGRFRVSRNDTKGAFTVTVDEVAYGLGSGTYLRMGRLLRPSAFGIGVGPDGLIQTWFYTRPPKGPEN